MSASHRTSVFRLPGPGRARRLFTVYVLLLLFTIGGAAAYLLTSYLPRQRSAAIAVWAARLEDTIADRKENIETWLEDGFRDARIIAANGAVRQAVGGERPPLSRGEMRAIVEETTEFGERGDVSSVWVFDAALDPVGSSAGTPTRDATVAEVLRQTVAGTRVPSDLYQLEDGHREVIFTAPILAGGRGVPLGVVAIAADPSSWLYPLLQRESPLTETGEILLFRHAGEAVTYLSPSRWTGEPPLPMRRPLSTADRPAAQALLERPGFSRFTDYRGATVLAATGHLESGPWSLIAKIDEAEALRPVAAQAREYVAAFGLAIFAVVAASAAVWRGQRAVHYLNLAASRAELAELFEHGPDAGFLVTDGRITAANAAAGTMFGVPSASLVGMFPWQLNPRLQPDGFSSETALRTWVEGLKPGSRRSLDWRCRRLDGAEFDAEISVTALAGESDRSLVWLRDVTERVRSQQALRRSEERFRTLVEKLGEGVILVDARERVVVANQAADAILGKEPGALVGHSILEFLAPESVETVREETALRHSGKASAYEITIVRPSGERRSLLVTATPQFGDGGEFNGAFAVLHDTTERRAIEDQLRHAQKLEAVGLLAGGIAHDFNNLLQAMLAFTQVLTARANDADRVRSLAAELSDHVRRGAGLARQLLLFSQRETTRLEVLDLAVVVRSSVLLLKRLLRESIVLDLQVSGEPLPVRADRGQLEQVLINLAVNAADAMPEGGALTLTCGACADRRVSLEVRDTGHGIPAEIKARIFEPFFTTKGAEKGSGLGLSVVHGIVTAHGGAISVESEPGAGTTFRVTLPRADAVVRSAETVEPGGGLTAAPIGHGERVLVVEDEPAAREGLAEVLTMLSYSVTAVGSGEEAGLLPAEPAFDVLLTDFLLPGVTGAELAGGLRDRWPGLAVVIMSGYTDDAQVRAAIKGGSVRFLQKPFTIEAVARELSAALAARERA